MKIRFAALRINSELSQETVANAFHISKSTLSEWENYTTSPTATQLQKLCNLYHCTLNDVFRLLKLSQESISRRNTMDGITIFIRRKVFWMKQG